MHLLDSHKIDVFIIKGDADWNLVIDTIAENTSATVLLKFLTNGVTLSYQCKMKINQWKTTC